MKDVLKYIGFIGSVRYAAEDRVFDGKVEGVNDLISFEGSTVDELEEGFQYMVDKHIEDCEKKEILISVCHPIFTRRLHSKLLTGESLSISILMMP